MAEAFAALVLFAAAARFAMPQQTPSGTHCCVSTEVFDPTVSRERQVLKNRLLTFVASAASAAASEDSLIDDGGDSIITARRMQCTLPLLWQQIPVCRHFLAAAAATASIVGTSTAAALSCTERRIL